MFFFSAFSCHAPLSLRSSFIVSHKLFLQPLRPIVVFSPLLRVCSSFQVVTTIIRCTVFHTFRLKRGGGGNPHHQPKWRHSALPKSMCTGTHTNTPCEPAAPRGGPSGRPTAALAYAACAACSSPAANEGGQQSSRWCQCV